MESPLLLLLLLQLLPDRRYETLLGAKCYLARMLLLPSINTLDDDDDGWRLSCGRPDDDDDANKWQDKLQVQLAASWPVALATDGQQQASWLSTRPVQLS